MESKASIKRLQTLRSIIDLKSDEANPHLHTVLTDNNTLFLSFYN
jgi:hypothetical protein